MHLMKNFQKGDINDVLKFVTSSGVSEKNAKKMFVFFAKITQF